MKPAAQSGRLNKTAAMEMSVGTIVTIVLLVTVLILGVVLVKNIFSSATSVVDLTDQQLKDEINKLFSEEERMGIYPGTREVKIKQESDDGIGFLIRNLKQGSAGEATFSYVVSASDVTNCGISKQVAESWITVGKQEDDIAIPTGGDTVRKIRFLIPLGSPLCTARFNIVVRSAGTLYESDFFDVIVKAK